MTKKFYNIEAGTQYYKTFSALFTLLLAYLPKSDSGCTTVWIMPKSFMKYSTGPNFIKLFWYNYGAISITCDKIICRLWLILWQKSFITLKPVPNFVKFSIPLLCCCLHNLSQNHKEIHWLWHKLLQKSFITLKPVPNFVKFSGPLYVAVCITLVKITSKYTDCGINYYKKVL
jgi:hypothetical protein